MFKILLIISLFVGPVFADHLINISGQVTPTDTLLPMTQLYVTATDQSTGSGTVSVNVSPFGYYTFYDLEGGNTYLIEAHAAKKFVAFTPETRTVFGTQSWTNINFEYTVICLDPCV